MNDDRYMSLALEQARACDPSPTAYCIGCVIVGADGRTVTGFSRETFPHEHAEEIAIERALKDDFVLGQARLYVTMEPCGKRASKPKCCADLILEHGIPAVVYAADEPPTFSKTSGAAKLRDAGVDVLHLIDFEGEALSVAERAV